MALVAGLGLAIGASVGGLWWFESGPGAWTEVPAHLVGTSAASAHQQLADRGLRVTLTAAHSNDAPSGAVLAAVPEPGTRIRRYQTVELAVSEGIRMVTVPTGLIGSHRSAADLALREARVRFGPPVSQYSDTVPAGNLMALSHPEGSQLPYFASLSYTVSAGPARVTVPQQVGRTVPEAEASLAALALGVEVVTDRGCTAFPVGTVCRQSPENGSVMRRGDVVTLKVAPGTGH